MQGAEAGRQAQYLLEVALPLEIRRVAREERGGREKGEGTGKRIALGGRGKEGGKRGKEGRRKERREKEGINRNLPFSFLGSSS